MQRGLFFKEWLAAALLLFLASFFLVGNWGWYTLKLRKVQPYSVKKGEWVQVSLSGAVCNPGVYEVEPGTSLKSVLDKAGLSKEADKQILYAKKTLLASCVVHVPEKTCKKRKKRNREIR